MVSSSPAFAVSQSILEMEYAVRGSIPARAAQLEVQGIKINPCHIGNHLRIAFLPSQELLAQVLPAWIRFHNQYMG